MNFIKKVFSIGVVCLFAPFSFPSTTHLFNSIFSSNDSHSSIRKIDSKYLNIDESGRLLGFKTEQIEDLINDINTNDWNTLFIPNNVISINDPITGVGAFSGWFTDEEYGQDHSSKIVNIIFEDNSKCQSIDEDTFGQCHSLQNVYLPDSITELGRSCFNQCTSLSNVRLSNNLTVIPSHAFAVYSGWESSQLTINLPDSLVEIGSNAFSNHSLNNIVIPEKVTKIGSKAFQNASINFFSFLCTNDSIISNISFGTDWCSGITYGSSDFLHCFVPYGYKDKYSAVLSPTYFAQSEINNGLIYTKAIFDADNLYEYDPDLIDIDSAIDYSLKYTLYPNVNSNLMDKNASYKASVSSSDNTTISFSDISDFTKCVLPFSIKKAGGVDFLMNTTCSISASTNLKDFSFTFQSSDKVFVQNQDTTNSLRFKDVTFQSYNLSPSDSPVATESLTNKVYDIFGQPVTTDLSFDLIDISGKAISSSWLTINQTSGVITIDPSSPSASTINDIRVKVTQTSTGYAGVSDNFSVIISSSPQPVVTELIIRREISVPPQDIGGIVNTDELKNYVYTNTGTQITDGLKFSIADDGVLPDGLSFNENTGKISGVIATTAKTATNLCIQVDATIGTQQLSGKTNHFSIVINDPEPVVTSLNITKPLTSYVVYKTQTSTPTINLSGSVYTNTGTQVTENLFFSAENLPDGLSCNPTTGVISGTPSNDAQSTLNIKITVKAIINEKEISGESNYFSIIVNEPDPVATELLINQEVLIDPVDIGQEVNTHEISHHVITNTGVEVKNATFEVDGGNLPTGLSLDKSSGEISGKVAYGAVSVSNLRIKASAVVDGVGLTGYTNYFSIIIKSQPIEPGLTINKPMLTRSASVGQMVVTDELSNYVTTTFGEKVNNATFSLEGDISSTGLEFDPQTGKITGIIIDGATTCINLRIKASAEIDKVTLEGYTNYFSIVIIDPSPTSTELNISKNVFIDQLSVGQQLSSVDLSDCVYTQFGTKVNNPSFRLEGDISQTGLSLNKSTGVISGTVSESATSCLNLRIEVTATIDGESYKGHSNYFSIVISSSPAPQPKTNNTPFFVLCCVLFCVAIVYGSVFAFLFMRNRMKS